MNDTPEEAVKDFLEFSQITNRAIFQCSKCQYRVASESDADDVGMLICCTCDEEMGVISQQCTITYSLEKVVQFNSSYGVMYGFGGLINESSDLSNS